jgi:hypothetical protein
MLKYYFGGLIGLFVFCLLSKLFAGKILPWELAKGEAKYGQKESYSASLLQMIVFTMLTVFAYCTVFAARIFENDGAGLLPSLKEGDTWLGIPSNLMILMGISVGTAVASRAIKVSQAKSGDLPPVDNSSLTTYHDGTINLVKIQMLIWTAIAVFIYLEILWRFMGNHCFDLASTHPCPKDWGNSLPDIDTAFLALLGVSQGGQVINQLSENSGVKSPAITNISIEPASVNLTVDAPTQALKATATDAQNNAISDLPEGTIKWTSDNPAIATVDENGLVTRVTSDTCNVTAAANSIVSNKCVVTCS